VEDLVAGSSKIRVGVVGLSRQQGFASIAHIPALPASPRFDAAVKRHRLIDASVRASAIRQKQR
jgi:predicted dehydrogenase